MRIDVLTLFPEMFASVLASSILKRAADPSLYAPAGPVQATSDGGSAATPVSGPPPDPSEAIRGPKPDGFNSPDPDRGSTRNPKPETRGTPVSYHLTDIRAYTTDKHGKVDKAPYGGGPGMVMQCEPIWNAVQAVEALDPRSAARILMTPQGQTLTQAMVEELARLPRLLVIAGHYEGIDERVVEKLAPIREVSIGDYVLSGGELPAMVLIDAVVRLIPGVLGDETSTHNESFSTGSGGILDYPQYTRPPVWMGLEVPQVLLSGDHGKVEAWRREQAKARTAARRPDLLPPL